MRLEVNGAGLSKEDHPGRSPDLWERLLRIDEPLLNGLANDVNLSLRSPSGSGPTLAPEPEMAPACPSPRMVPSLFAEDRFVPAHATRSTSRRQPPALPSGYVCRARPPSTSSPLSNLILEASAANTISGTEGCS